MSRTSLATLAARINDEHRLVEEAIESTLLHARRAGDLLIEVKDSLQHGAWLPWVSKNCAFTIRTADSYMRISRNWSTITAEANSQRASNLSIREGLRLLTDQADVEEPVLLPPPDPAAEQAELEQMLGAALAALPAERQLEVIQQEEERILERQRRREEDERVPPADVRRQRLEQASRHSRKLRSTLEGLGSEADAALRKLNRVDLAIADLEAS